MAVIKLSLNNKIIIVVQFVSTYLNQRNFNYGLAYTQTTENDIEMKVLCNGTLKLTQSGITVINPDYKLQ